MLTTTEANLLKSNVDKSLLDMEKFLPTAKSNVGEVALRYWLYNWAERQLASRLRSIDKEAILTGLIFDHKKHPLPAGTDRPLYQDENVAIRVEVKQPGKRIDVPMLRHLLLTGKHISATVLDELIAEATIENAPAHQFKSTLVEGELAQKEITTTRDTIY